MQIETKGLIIRENSVGESDRLVTVLTSGEGVVRAFAQQAKKLKNSKLSATQLFSYSRLTIFKGRDKYIIDDAQPIEVFFDLRRDIERLSLAQYFCELAGALAPQEAEAGDFLRLMLNSFHFLCRGLRPNAQIKAIVEMKMLSLAGYMPNLICCSGCSCYEAEEMFFLPRKGLIYCGDCFVDSAEPAVRLSRGALTGLRHIIYADFEKLFSFSLSQQGLKELSAASEQYVLSTLERSFNTLEFYRQMKTEDESTNG
ncbi:DNA repair protein RecO [Clostridium sp. KNHs216]|uniref:DNA repair protein RecO n=1 Tax=Eubacteriales TaxID=186802 RepID=UPI00114E7973|nr:DNA repair protein RecO [Clostridium sp. KNHs216]TQI68754.1 DNA replication and repair protein RecO [Clostridium sp. KNHs216]